jgi:hypothetical protein
MIKIKKYDNAKLQPTIIRHGTGEVSTIYEVGIQNIKKKVYFLGIKLWETSKEKALDAQIIDDESGDNGVGFRR